MISAESKSPSIRRFASGTLTYEEYHRQSLAIGDIDPSYEMLRYVSRRFELNIEQRFWLAFLYATCYCGATAFYIYNEFPDFENVDEGRLDRWWTQNRSRLFFQTDRARIRSNNQFTEIFRSYRNIVGGLSQRSHFRTFETISKEANYENAWASMSGIYQFGRFAMFLYLEAVHVVTEFPMRPRTMDMSKAESCSKGLIHHLGHKDWLIFPRKINYHYLQNEFEKLVRRMEKEDNRNSVWNVETTLCAYQKYMNGKRWPGYYLDRQAEEISKMQKNVPEGVDWSVLWDYRKETYGKQYLSEFR